jgi:hypothetical protein
MATRKLLLGSLELDADGIGRIGYLMPRQPQPANSGTPDVRYTFPFFRRSAVHFMPFRCLPTQFFPEDRLPHQATESQAETENSTVFSREEDSSLCGIGRNYRSFNETATCGLAGSAHDFTMVLRKRYRGSPELVLT